MQTPRSVLTIFLFLAACSDPELSNSSTNHGVSLTVIQRRFAGGQSSGSVTVQVSVENNGFEELPVGWPLFSIVTDLKTAVSAKPSQACAADLVLLKGGTITCEVSAALDIETNIDKLRLTLPNGQKAEVTVAPRTSCELASALTSACHGLFEYCKYPKHRESCASVSASCLAGTTCSTRETCELPPGCAEEMALDESRLIDCARDYICL